MSTPARVPKNFYSDTSNPTGPALLTGDAYYFSTNKTLRLYDGAAWVELENLSVAQTITGAKTYTGGVIVNTTGITGNKEINLTGTAASSVAGTFTGTALIPSGLTGATTPTRYVGGTASGAPASGTFSLGDWIVTQNGSIYICTLGGTSGTWSQVSGGGGTPATTVTTLDGLQSAVVGTSTNYAREDHKHAVIDVVDTATTQNSIAGQKIFTGSNLFWTGSGTFRAGQTSDTVGNVTGALEVAAGQGLLHAMAATVGSQTKNAELYFQTSRWSSAPVGDTTGALRLVQNSATANDAYWQFVSGGFTDLVEADQFRATGQTGAVTTTKWAGAKSSGTSPATGTFVVGDWIINTGNNKFYICTVAGTPGTWTELGGGGSSPLTTKGDIFTYDTGSQRLGVGANDTVLVPDSSAGTGLRWSTSLTMASTIQATQVTVTGQVGANSNAKLAGGISTGPPSTGTFAIGDFVISRSDGRMYVCTGAPTTFTLVGTQEIPVTFTWPGTLATAVGVDRFYVKGNYTVTAVRAYVGTTSGSGNTRIDVDINGTSLWNVTQGNRPSLNTAGSGVDYVTTFDTPSATPAITDGQYLTMDIDSVGSGAAPANLTVIVWLQRTS